MTLSLLCFALVVISPVALIAHTLHGTYRWRYVLSLMLWWGFAWDLWPGTPWEPARLTVFLERPLTDFVDKLDRARRSLSWCRRGFVAGGEAVVVLKISGRLLLVTRVAEPAWDD